MDTKKLLILQIIALTLSLAYSSVLKEGDIKQTHFKELKSGTSQTFSYSVELEDGLDLSDVNVLILSPLAEEHFKLKMKEENFESEAQKLISLGKRESNTFDFDIELSNLSKDTLQNDSFGIVVTTDMSVPFVDNTLINTDFINRSLTKIKLNLPDDIQEGEIAQVQIKRSHSGISFFCGDEEKEFAVDNTASINVSDNIDCYVQRSEDTPSSASFKVVFHQFNNENLVKEISPKVTTLKYYNIVKNEINFFRDEDKLGKSFIKIDNFTNGSKVHASAVDSIQSLAIKSNTAENDFAELELTDELDAQAITIEVVPGNDDFIEINFNAEPGVINKPNIEEEITPEEENVPVVTVVPEEENKPTEQAKPEEQKQKTPIKEEPISEPSFFDGYTIHVMIIVGIVLLGSLLIYVGCYLAKRGKVNSSSFNSRLIDDFSSINKA